MNVNEKELNEINAQAVLPGIPDHPAEACCKELERVEYETAREFSLMMKRSQSVALARSYHDRGAYSLRDAVLNDLAKGETT